MTIRIAPLFIATFCLAGQVGAQSTETRQPGLRRPAAVSVEDATELTNGWALLAEGRADQAEARAEKVLASSPRNLAAVVLAIESAIARAGAASALTTYEKFLAQAQRPFEEPALLRRVAEAALREESAQQQDSAARVQALRGLAAAGDAPAEAQLLEAAKKGGAVETRELAAEGNAEAVSLLLADLSKGTGNAVLILDALGRSGSERAVKPIAVRLDDQRSEVRGAAADALGRLEAAETIPRLKSMLADQSGFVRMKAAGALYRLQDDSGLEVLQTMLSDPDPQTRIAAAAEMESRPYQNWIDLLRELASAPDAAVRIGAARLIAPHDEAFARALLEPFATDQNPAIRELALQATTEIVTDDLTALRRLMSNEHRLTRVRAASRVMFVTR